MENVDRNQNRMSTSRGIRRSALSITSTRLGRRLKGVRPSRSQFSVIFELLNWRRGSSRFFSDVTSPPHRTPVPEAGAAEETRKGRGGRTSGHPEARRSSSCLRLSGSPLTGPRSGRLLASDGHLAAGRRAGRRRRRSDRPEFASVSAAIRTAKAAGAAAPLLV